MQTSPLSALPFRPVSFEDFSAYAKALSRLIDEGLQVSQELLAKGYGHSNRYALKQFLTVAGEPGPYAREAYNYQYAVPNRQEFCDAIRAREQRFLSLVAAQKGLSVEQLPDKCLKISQLGLFDRPDVHRAAKRRIFDALGLLEGRRLPEQKAKGGVLDYAYVVMDSKGRAALKLTRLGMEVRELLESEAVWAEPGPAGDADRETQMMLVRRLFREHPGCPFPLAELIATQARYQGFGGFQMPRSGRLPFGTKEEWGLEYPPVTDAFKQSLVPNAKKLLPDVKAAVALFEELFGDAARIATDQSEFADDDDFDGDTWPYLLYFGGLVAVYAGERSYGLRLLKKLTALEGALPPQNWASKIMPVLLMEEGRSAVSKFIRSREQEQDVRGRMAQIVTTCCEDRRTGAVLFVGELARCSAALEHFNPEVAPPPRTEGFFDSSHALFEEFLFLADRFLSSHPEVMGFLGFIAKHNSVVATLPEYFGKSGLEPSVAARKERKQRLDAAAIEACADYLVAR